MKSSKFLCSNDYDFLIHSETTFHKYKNLCFYAVKISNVILNALFGLKKIIWHIFCKLKITNFKLLKIKIMKKLISRFKIKNNMEQAEQR